MSIKNHLYCLYPLLLFTAVIILGLLLFDKLDVFLADPFMRKFMFSIYAIFLIPVLFLHIEYILRDWNVSFKISKGNTFVYQKGKRETRFTLDEISRVNFFGETKIFNNLPTQNYSFYIFKLKDGQRLTVTRLTVGNLYNVIPVSKTTMNRRLFPSVLIEA